MRKILYAILFFIFLIATLPKENLWYFFEKHLKKENIYINNEKVIDNFYQLRILDANIIYNGVKFAKIENIDIYPYIIFNNIDINSFKSKLFSDLDIKKITLKYSILYPVKGFIDIKSNYFNAKGDIDFLNKKILLKFFDIKKLSVLKKVFKKIKKSDEGYFVEIPIG